MSVHTGAVHRVAAAPFVRACLYYSPSSTAAAASVCGWLQLADREGQLSALREAVARMAAEIARLNEQARAAASNPSQPPSKRHSAALR